MDVRHWQTHCNGIGCPATDVDRPQTEVLDVQNCRRRRLDHQNRGLWASRTQMLDIQSTKSGTPKPRMFKLDVHNLNLRRCQRHCGCPEPHLTVAVTDVQPENVRPGRHDVTAVRQCSARCGFKLSAHRSVPPVIPVKRSVATETQDTPSSPRLEAASEAHRVKPEPASRRC